MAKLSKLRQLQLKRRATEEEIARHQEAISSLQSKLSEYEIAERVLASLDDDIGEETHADENQDEAPMTAASSSTIKPDGLPTMPAMIVASLIIARTRGQNGLEPREMAELIEERYWRGMPLHIVGPTAWRMYKDGRLAKRESKYFLIQTGEGSDAETSEPSSSNSGADSDSQGPASKPTPAGSVSSTRLRRDLFASTAIPAPYVPPREEGRHVM